MLSKSRSPHASLADETTREIACQLGISRQLVERIEKRALAKMRERLLARGVTAEDVRGLGQKWSVWE